MDYTALKRGAFVVVVVLVAIAASAHAAPTLAESSITPVSITTETALIEKSQLNEGSKCSKAGSYTALWGKYCSL